MATLKTTTVALLTGVGLALGGCSSSGSGGFLGLGDSSPITTSSLPEAAKVDPACAGLSSQIAALRQEGVADRIEKAAAKKYKMTAADLTKADQLTKASADYQAKCSVGGKAVVASATATSSTAGTTNIGSSTTTTVKAATTASKSTTSSQ